MSFNPIFGLKSLVSFVLGSREPSPPLPPETIYPYHQQYSPEIEAAITESITEEFEFLSEKKGGPLPRIVIHSKNIWNLWIDELGTLNKVSELMIHISRKMGCPPEKIVLNVEGRDLLNYDKSLLDETIQEVFQRKRMKLDSPINALDGSIQVDPVDLSLL